MPACTQPEREKLGLAPRSLYISSLALRPSRSGPQGRGQLSFACSVSLPLLMAKHPPLLLPPLSELLVRLLVSEPSPLLEGFLSLVSSCSCLSPRDGVRPKMRGREQQGVPGQVRGMSHGSEAGKGRVWCGGTMRSL